MQIFKYLMLLLLLGCECYKEVPPLADQEGCIYDCINDYVRNYADEIYSTQDKFVDQFEKLCRLKAKSHYCYKYSHGYTFYTYKIEERTVCGD